MTVVLALPAATVRADLVVLNDGRELKGRVINLGTNAIELRVRPGMSRHIHLRDIRRATFDLQGEQLALDQDIVFRKSGGEISGKVTYSPEGNVIVTSSDGSRVVIPRQGVSRIVTRDQATIEGAVVYSKSIQDDIQASIDRILREGKAEGAEKRLGAYGLFAIDRVREAREKAVAGTPAARSLDRVIREYRLKEITPDVLQNLPEYFNILISGSPDRKQELLMEMFTRYVKESVPLAKYMILDADEDPNVRALAVALLGQNGCNRDLIEVYNLAPGGKVQLAAAIALARNRLLLGAETLIDALQLYEPKVREMAFNALQEATGKDFGFEVHDTPSARRIAISRWKRWWSENRSTIQSHAATILSGKPEMVDSPERKKASNLWDQGCRALDREDHALAEQKLRAAVDADPSFVNAQVSLAILLCLHRNKGREGRSLLENLLERGSPKINRQEATWITYYLGLAWEAEGNLEQAELKFRNVLRLDQKFFQAALSLGDLKFRQAISESRPREVNRRNFMGEAETFYRSAINMMVEYSDGLKIIESGDLPQDLPPAFERRFYNRTLLDLKDNLRQKRATAHYALAKIRSLLDDRPRAIAELNDAIDVVHRIRGNSRGEAVRDLLIDLHNYRGFLFEEEGQIVKALQDYRAVLNKDLDPRNATALEGVRRLTLKPRSGSDRSAMEWSTGRK